MALNRRTEMAKSKNKSRKRKLDINATRSLAIIMLKGIATDLRNKFPNYRIEAHPHTDSSAELFIGRRDVENSIKVNLAKDMSWAGDEYKYRATQRLTINGQDRKRFGNQILVINIQEPDSLTNLEKWILESLEIVNAEPQDAK